MWSSTASSCCQRQAEQFGGDLAGDVVAGRPEPAGDDDDVAPRDGLEQGQPDFLAVRDADLPLDAQSELKQLAAQPVGMGVERLPEQELGAGVDQVDAHGEFETRGPGATTCCDRLRGGDDEPQATAAVPAHASHSIRFASPHKSSSAYSSRFSGWKACTIRMP